MEIIQKNKIGRLCMNYEQFKAPVYELTHVDLNAYKERQMKRRIDALIMKHHFLGYDDYIEAIKKDKILFEEFVSYITINVSEFFRNYDQWEILEKEIIPELRNNNSISGNIKIWSAACSTGDEPYALALLMS